MAKTQAPAKEQPTEGTTQSPALPPLPEFLQEHPVRTLNNLATEVGGFRYSRGFSPRGRPRFAVTPTTKSLLTHPLYGKGRNPPPSEPPELALGDPFSGLNDYDTGVKPGCYSG